MNHAKITLSLLSFALLTLWSDALVAAPLGTAFTYDGLLADGGGPANGSYDLRFSLYPAATGGGQIGSTLTNTSVAVSNGLFTTTLDFGAGVFNGAAYWLSVGGRTNGSSADFITLIPRQPITAAPYALYAINAGAATTATTATTASGVAPNAVTGAGIQDATITAAKLASGQVVKSLNGLTDNVTVSAGAGLSLSGTTFSIPNGGVTGALLADGSVTSNKLSAAGAAAGQIFKYDGTRWTLAADNNTTYSAGAGLTLSGNQFSVNFGGSGSTSSAARSDHNHDATYARLVHTHAAADIISGTLGDARLSANVVLLNANQTLTGSNIFNGVICATNPANKLTGNFTGDGSGLTSVSAGNVVGTLADAALSPNIPRLDANQTFTGRATFDNPSNSFAGSFMGDGSGLSNVMVSASFVWQLTGNSGTTAGAQFLGTSDNQPLELKVNNYRALRLEPNATDPSLYAPNMLGGYFGNNASASVAGATIGGGGASGGNNRVTDDYGTVSGGANNQAGDDAGTTSDRRFATVGGGFANTASGDSSVVEGGSYNTASGDFSAVGGGQLNSSSGQYAAVPGGYQNNAAGDYSFAAGRRAQALHAGSFVWGDSTDADIASTSGDQFIVRASGGIQFYGPLNSSGVADGGAIISGVNNSPFGSDGLYGEVTGPDGTGVHGVANNGANAYGVWGQSSGGYAVYGSHGASGNYGYLGSGAYGVYGFSPSSDGRGVYGEASGTPNTVGVYGKSAHEDGVYGESLGSGGNGVHGVANGGPGAWGVFGTSSNGVGVVGISDDGDGVVGEGGDFAYGVHAKTQATILSGAAVFGEDTMTGVWGKLADPSHGVVGYAPSNTLSAGYFYGNLSATDKQFQIDHPLDPANKYLNHGCVESPDRKNVYDGVISLDANGEAWVELPSYFEALNEEFRYQLTAIGAPGPDLHVAEKISGNRFKIAGGPAGLEVSWQVTGVRKDAYAKAHPMIVEKEKPKAERGKYVSPQSFGLPEEMGLGYVKKPRPR